MKAVLDTNVWLSGLFWGGAASRIIEIAEKGKIKLLISEEIINEIVRVLKREDKFQKFIEEFDNKVEDLVRFISFICEFVEISGELDIVKEDKSDNMILETALEGAADYLVSYDNHLLVLKEFKGVKIVKPEEFLSLT